MLPEEEMGACLLRVLWPPPSHTSHPPALFLKGSCRVRHSGPLQTGTSCPTRPTAHGSGAGRGPQGALGWECGVISHPRALLRLALDRQSHPSTCEHSLLSGPDKGLSGLGGVSASPQ